MNGATRKYLPAEAYRFLALEALRAAGIDGLTKGRLAREIRANHYMLSRVVADLAGDEEVVLLAEDDGSFRITLTHAGREALEDGRAFFVRTFRRPLRRHFAYGRLPGWASEYSRV